MDAYVGIDLAIAKRKRLPVALCTWEGDRLIPVNIAEGNAPEPPRGSGNVAVLDRSKNSCFVEETAEYLRKLEAHFEVSIRRIAIDAPSCPRKETLNRRRAEAALDAARISCFTTPSSTEFDVIREKVKSHLRAGGAESRLPHANQLWMLMGFALFARLCQDWECLEVFPQATAVALNAGMIHKSKRGGIEAQLTAVAKYTGWPASFSNNVFKGVVCGPNHDGLDAYLAAWVAALPPYDRTALGMPPDDVVWIPKLESFA
jgi:hypothetical protein